MQELIKQCQTYKLHGCRLNALICLPNPRIQPSVHPFLVFFPCPSQSEIPNPTFSWAQVRFSAWHSRLNHLPMNNLGQPTCSLDPWWGNESSPSSPEQDQTIHILGFGGDVIKSKRSIFLLQHKTLHSITYSCFSVAVRSNTKLLNHIN